MRNISSDRERIYDDCRKSVASFGVTSLDALRDTHVQLTGATGFVGTWLLSMLSFLNDTHGFNTRVTAVARNPSVMQKRVAFLVDRPDINWTAADVRQLVSVPDRLTWMIHAAAVPDSRHHATSPIETASVIAEGTSRILRLAEQAGGLRRILYFSSGLVETAGAGMGMMGPTATYVEAKRFAETLCYAYRTQAKLPIVITRPYTLIGPFQDLDSPWAANNFLHAALEGQPLKIRGDGRAVRSYLYGSDMALTALGQMIHGDSGGVYDLGGNDALTVLELANIVARQSHRALEIRTNTGLRHGGEDRFVPDAGRSCTAFPVSSAFTTEQAVARSLAWYD